MHFWSLPFKLHLCYSVIVLQTSARIRHLWVLRSGACQSSDRVNPDAPVSIICKLSITFILKKTKHFFNMDEKHFIHLQCQAPLF